MKYMFLSVMLFAYTVYALDNQDYCQWLFADSAASPSAYAFQMTRFHSKFKNPPPQWMQDRLKKDFSDFNETPITREGIKATFEKICSLYPRGLARYRFIDSHIYRQGEDLFGLDNFFRAVRDLASYQEAPDLPNIEFIYSFQDGTPLDNQVSNFWIVDDRNMQAPVLTYAKSKDAPFTVAVMDRFTIPDWEKLAARILSANRSRPFRRKQKMAFWRGGATDFAKLSLGNAPFALIKDAYELMPRYRICKLSKERPDMVDAGFSDPGFAAVPNLISLIQPFYKSPVLPEDHLHYAYLPVLDGYSSTYPGYLWRLLSNSVVFKQESKDSQWFYDALEPYVHYIPIKNDMSDLIEKIEWARTHEQECIQIAKTATQFVIDNLLLEDCYRYFFEVLLTYKQHQNFDTKELLDETLSDPSWIHVI